MKKYSFILILLFSKALFCQTYTLQPDATKGIDAAIYDDDPTSNFGTTNEFIAFFWTRNGHDFEGRSLLKFDLSSIPIGKTIVSAKLSLYWDQLASAGQYGDNSAKLSRVTSAWNEDLVNWNNKPSVSASDFLILPMSTIATQDYIDIDVTSMVTPMYNTPSSNYGFQIEEIIKSTYRSMKFASSDHTVASKRPKLVIVLASCDAQVTFQPTGLNGIDAVLKENDPNTASAAGNDDEFISYDWSFGGIEAKGVSLLKFDFSSISPNATILSAQLSLFYNPTSSSAGQYGDNTSNLKRVTSSWNENTVTWNTKPTTTNTGQVTLAMSTSTSQDNIDFDVLSLVAPMISNQSTNYGMMLQLVNTGIYRSMKFCSSDYTDPNKRPRLKICYSFGTGLNNASDLLNKSIYPNPTHSLIFLTGFMVDCKYTLCDLFGKNVLNGKIIDNTIDLNGIEKGIYIFKTEDFIRKIVIN